MKWLVILALVPCMLGLTSGQASQNLLKLVSDFPEIKNVNVSQLWGDAPELNIKITVKREDCPATACPAPPAAPQEENSCKTNPIRDCSCFNITSHPFGFNAEIQPLKNGLKFNVFCNVQDGKLWTRILERMYYNRAEMGLDGFNRNFAQYQAGFGTLAGNNFMGLDKIHELTQAVDMQLWVKFFDENWASKDGKFTTFKVAGKEDNYRLTLAGGSGNLGSLMLSNGQPFSANDKDNGGQGCPTTQQAGWWFPATCADSCTMTGPWANVMCDNMKSKVVSFYVLPK